jgi:predicted glycosyltransferase involved in capsule biosynthesis
MGNCLSVGTVSVVQDWWGKLVEVMDMLISMIVEMAHRYMHMSKLIKLYILNMYRFLYISYISTKMLKSDTCNITSNYWNV